MKLSEYKIGRVLRLSKTQFQEGVKRRKLIFNVVEPTGKAPGEYILIATSLFSFTRNTKFVVIDRVSALYQRLQHEPERYRQILTSADYEHSVVLYCVKHNKLFVISRNSMLFTKAF